MESGFSGKIEFGCKKDDFKIFEADWSDINKICIVINDIDFEDQLCEKIKLAFFKIKCKIEENLQERKLVFIVKFDDLPSNR